jgi:hypothetical protein
MKKFEESIEKARLLIIGKEMIKFSVQPLLCLFLGCFVDFSFAQHVITVAEENGGFGKLVTLLDSANSVKQLLVTGRDISKW